MSKSVLYALKETEKFVYHEHDNGLQYYRHDYFVKHDDLERCPQSYLIKQLPNITNPMHFHTQNQFQVFISGSGRFGRHTIAPYVVHYAGAYTGYGPIVAGVQGLDYLTLRSSRDLGAKFLPAQRTLLKKGPKHHYTSEALLADDCGILEQLEQTTFTWAHHDTSTQLGIGVLKMPPGAQFEVPVAEQSAGVFLVVMQGSVDLNGEPLRHHENAFIPSAGTPNTLLTGLQAVQILVLQMPLKDVAYSQ